MVKVGAATETEMKEKKHRVEDALQATRAALEEGIVPGGGVALLQASSRSRQRERRVGRRLDDERTGARIVLRALEEPLRQLAENAGLEGSVVVNDVRKAKKGQGLNAATNEIVDLVAAGIIDPAMVTRSALQNAASIAKNILTTEAIVAEVPEKEGAGARRRRHAGHERDDVGRAGSRSVSEPPSGPRRTGGSRQVVQKRTRPNGRVLFRRSVAGGSLFGAVDSVRFRWWLMYSATLRPKPPAIPMVKTSRVQVRRPGA